MEEYILNNDITVFCITADSFPEGITQAHTALHALAPASEGRKYFGISRPENGGKIVYRAGAEELVKGELGKQGLEEFVITKGKYVCLYVNNIAAISDAFQQLIRVENIDPKGYCIECYLGDTEIRCMVKLQS